MRIFKEVPNWFDCLVGEMYNIESGKLAYDLGRPLEVPEAGYPRVLCKGGKRYDIKATLGYIFVTNWIDLGELAKRLNERLGEMPSDHLNEYHGFAASRHVTIKVKPALAITCVDPAWNATNIKRAFRVNSNTYTVSHRFTWFILPASEFDSCRGVPMLRHACSILLDLANLCSLEHNSTTMNHTLDDMRGSDICVKKMFEPRLSKYGHPLRVFLSDYWADSTKLNTMKYHSIDPTKLFHANWEDLRDPQLSCAICKSTLFGEAYALAWRTHLTADPGTVDMACAVCVHRDRIPSSCNIDSLYKRIYRVRVPRVIDEVIDIKIANIVAKSQAPETKGRKTNSRTKPIEVGDVTILKKVLQAADKGVTYGTHMFGGKAINYALIGDEFLGVTKLEHYLYSGMANEPMFSGRRVVEAHMVAN